MAAIYDLSDLLSFMPFTRVGAESPLLWKMNSENSHVLYLADEVGLWMQVPAEHNEAVDMEAITGFREGELTLKLVEGVGVYALRGGQPLLAFPFTASELRAFDHRTGGVFSEHFSNGSHTDKRIADLAERNPKAASLAKALLSTEAQSAEPRAVGPLPLSSAEVAHCFAKIRWSESGWKNVLSSQRKWLAPCIAVQGIQGKAPRQWDPVLLGRVLVAREEIPLHRIRALFQTVQRLRPWLDAWKTCEAEYFGTE